MAVCIRYEAQYLRPTPDIRPMVLSYPHYKVHETFLFPSQELHHPMSDIRPMILSYPHYEVHELSYSHHKAQDGCVCLV